MENMSGIALPARTRTLTLLALFLLGLTSPASGMEIGGVVLPETMTVDQTGLTLNGAGLRSKFFIKVYAGGLYLSEPSNDPTAIIEADDHMVVRLHFIYDGVSPENLVEAWNEGFDAATQGRTASINGKIKAFNALFKKEARKGDVYDLVYLPQQGVQFLVNNVLQGVIPGLDFKRALFGIWLGDKPADTSLKKGMLGG